ncbi:MAG: DUF3370 family protein, partial [Synechococcus sp.]|nr:DUF3370 family protein [Synechococcus sp.]
AGSAGEGGGREGATGRRGGGRFFPRGVRGGGEGPNGGTVFWAPGESGRVQVRLVYPADATPPQVLSVLPVKQSNSTTDVHP